MLCMLSQSLDSLNIGFFFIPNSSYALLSINYFMWERVSVYGTSNTAAATQIRR